ncbi:unnamed protein product [Euphydryas editha]|uniref:C2H2-type domain-containing protein n=1 Tax=Euphydryas editha TaxID=104508 RepID=A0AAU9TV49_EUPED|nr:unnamed protein product [Euphydryas editha]
MGDCFICKKALIDDIYVAKKRAVRTLLTVSEKRGHVDHQRMLESVESVSVHRACYKNYANERLASFVARRTKSVSEEQEPEPEPEPKQQQQLEDRFDFKNKCLFCGVPFSDQTKTPMHRRHAIRTVREKSMKDNVLKYLLGRNDEFAASIVKRVCSVPDLIAVEARYHRECMHRVYNPVPEEGAKRGRPTGNKVDEAMEGIYSFLKENSDECQFSMTELMSHVNGNFVPHIKTVKAHLEAKYGEDILIIEKQKRDCVVCFRNTGFKILADKWYQEKKQNYHEERLRVIREAAAIIREDIRGVVYDKQNYPPSDEFVRDVEALIESASFPTFQQTQQLEEFTEDEDLQPGPSKRKET